MASASSMSMPPEASGPVLAASSPIRTGPLPCANARLGLAMVAMPAPATPDTNCRREIVMIPSRGNSAETPRLLFSWTVYRTEALNDQVITMLFGQDPATHLSRKRALAQRFDAVR